jgi:hypothetical protein
MAKREKRPGGEESESRLGGPDPMIGWRIWRLGTDDGVLRSCVVAGEWSPGINAASCLAGRPCDRTPGPGCRCGFWATKELAECLARARGDRTEYRWAMGLVYGWGEVAVHGAEGFRAEKAAIACLFTDWPWGGIGGSRLPLWIWRLRECVNIPSVPIRPHPQRLAGLRMAAEHYGVPLLSLSQALGSGLLEEFGLSLDRRHRTATCIEHMGLAGAA